MIRLHFILVFFLVVAAVAASSLFVPDRQEQALIFWRSMRLADARSYYEDMYNSGEQNPQVVIPLSRIYLDYGEVDRAIEMVEQVMAKHPNDIELLRIYADYLRYAQRLWAHARVLAKIARIKPDVEILTELSDLYSFLIRPKEQIAVLKKMVKLFPDHIPGYVDLATIYAAQKQFDQAAKVLTKLAAEHPDEIDSGTNRLYVSSLLNSGQAEQAYYQAQNWLEAHVNPLAAAELATDFNSRNRPELAGEILQPFVEGEDIKAVLLSVYAQIMMRLNNRNAAYTLLARVYQNNMLPASLRPTLLELALTEAKPPKFFNIVLKTNPRRLPGGVLDAVIERVGESGRVDVLAYLDKHLQDDFLKYHPVLGAKLALLHNDYERFDYWVSRTLRIEDTTITQKESLAEVMIRANRNDSAKALLVELAAQGQITDYGLLTLAGIYRGQGQIDEALKLFGALKNTYPQKDFGAAIATLHLWSGQTQKTTNWLLAMQGKKIATAFNDEIARYAANRKLTEVRVLLGQNMVFEKADDMALSYLASSLMEFDNPLMTDLLTKTPPQAIVDPDRAIAIMMSSVSGVLLRNPDSIGSYVSALYALSGVKNAPLVPHLIEKWSKILKSPLAKIAPPVRAVEALLYLDAFDRIAPLLEKLAADNPDRWLSVYISAYMKSGAVEQATKQALAYLNDAQVLWQDKENLIYGVQDSLTPRNMVPLLRVMVAKDDKNWAYAYTDALQKAGMEKELLAYLLARGRNGDVTMGRRREIAYALMGFGQKEEAGRILKELATEQQDIAHEDVQALLYLWGPRPNNAQTAWIFDKAKNAPEKFKADWVVALVDRGQIGLVEQLFDGKRVPNKLVLPYVQALLAARQNNKAKQVLAKGIKDTDRIKYIRMFGASALEQGFLPIALDAFKRIEYAKPRDVQAVANLGRIHYYTGAQYNARKYLAKAVDLGTKDAELYLFYGDILQNQNENENAMLAYRLGLNRIENSKEDSLAGKRLHATLLARTQNYIEARRLYAWLLGKQPQDAALRNEYARLLMDMGQQTQALQVMGL